MRKPCHHTLDQNDEVPCPVDICSGGNWPDGDKCACCHGCGVVPRMVPCPCDLLGPHPDDCHMGCGGTNKVPGVEAVIEMRQDASGQWFWRIIPGGGMRVQRKTDGFYWKHREATHNAAVAAAREAAGRGE